jgi:hypothetical protein
MRVMRRSISRKLSGAHTMVFWIICRAVRRAATAVFRQALKTRNASIIPPRLFGVTVRMPEGRMRGILGVEVVVLAAPAPILPVGRGDLEHCDPGLLQEAQEPGAIAAGRLDTDALDVAERAHPNEHLSIALAGTGEGLRPQHTVLLVDHGRDVQVLVGIDTSDDARNFSLSFHGEPPGSTVIDGFAETDCMDRTVT